MNPTEKGFLERWSDIINSVDKTAIPINYVKKVTVKIGEKNQKTIDIEKMKRQGLSPETIDSILYETVYSISDNIEDIDFHVDIDAVAKLVQQETNRLLNLN